MRILISVLLFAGVATAQDLTLDDGSMMQVSPDIFETPSPYAVELTPEQRMRYPYICHDGQELLAFEGDESCSVTISKRVADDLVKELERHGYEIKKKAEVKRDDNER